VTGIDDFITGQFLNDVVEKKILQWGRRASIIPEFKTTSAVVGEVQKENTNEILQNNDSIEFRINELYESINSIRQKLL
jgi:hypothetical protein